MDVLVRGCLQALVLELRPGGGVHDQQSFRGESRVGWLGIPGSFIAAGAFAATVLVLFVGGGGAGSIFPIALAGGALLIAAATLTGGWLGSEIRRSLDRRS